MIKKSLQFFLNFLLIIIFLMGLNFIFLNNDFINFQFENKNSLSSLKEKSFDTSFVDDYDYEVYNEYTLLFIESDSNNYWYEINNQQLTYLYLEELDSYNFNNLISIDDYWVHFNSDLGDDYFNLTTKELIKGTDWNIGLYKKFWTTTNTKNSIIGGSKTISQIHYSFQGLNENENVEDKIIKESSVRYIIPDNESVGFFPIFISDYGVLFECRNLDHFGGYKYLYWSFQYQTTFYLQDKNGNDFVNSSDKFNNLKAINSIWIEDLNTKQFLWQFNNGSISINESFSFTEEYGKYINNYQLLYLDGETAYENGEESGYFILNLQENNINYKNEINYSKVNIVTDSQNPIISYTQTTEGDYFYLQYNFDNQNYDLYFIDSSSSESINNDYLIEPTKITTLDSNINLIWSNNYYFIYEQDQNLKIETYGFVELQNYTGNYFYNNGFYFDKPFELVFSNPNIEKLELNGQPIEPDENNNYYISIGQDIDPNESNLFISNKIKIKYKSDSNLITLPNFYLYQNMAPFPSFNNENGEVKSYVSTENDYFNIDSYFVDTVYSDLALTLSIESNIKPLIKKISILNQEDEVIYYQNDYLNNDWSYLLEQGVFELKIDSNFNQSYYLQIFVNTQEHPQNYFETEEGQRFMEAAIEDGYSDDLLYYYNLNSVQTSLIANHLNNLINLSEINEQINGFLFEEYYQTLLENLIKWNDNHKIPLNSYSYVTKNNDISLGDVIMITTVDLFNEWISDYYSNLNAINQSSLVFDFGINTTNKINQFSSFSIRGAPESIFIGEFNFSFDLNYFNYVDLSLLNQNEKLNDDLYNAYDEVLKKYDSNVNFSKVEGELDQATIDALNLHPEIWTDNYIPRDLKSSDLEIKFEYKEKEIKGSDILSDFEYLMVKIDPKVNKSVAINTSANKVSNPNYKYKGVFYNFKGLFIFLSILFLILIILFTFFVLLPRIKYINKTKKINSKQLNEDEDEKINYFNEEEKEINLENKIK